MSQFQPNSFTLDPPELPEELASALLQSLARRMDNPKMCWSLPKTTFLGAISFGVWPLFSWQQRFRDFITQEQSQLWHLAEWLRLQTGRAEATQLRDETLRMRWRLGLSVLSFVAMLGVVGAFVLGLMGHSDVAHKLVASTYEFGKRPYPFSEARPLFIVWTLGLSFGYLCHWLQVMLHTSELRRLVRRFNVVAQSEGIAAVRVPEVEFGLRPFWLVAAALFAGGGAVWGVPMMLAGALQRRYIKVISAGVRRDLAFAVRSVLMMRRPALNVQTPMPLRRRCRNQQCLANVPHEAAFCQRCGSPLAARLDRVA